MTSASQRPSTRTTDRASDRAYASIRAHILAGKIAPGEQLTEEQLAEISGVSRTPVRDAVRRLESEMLLVRSESKRIFVADWSSDDIEELFTLRQMLEGHAAKRAAERITPEQLEQLIETNKRLSGAVSSDPPDIKQFLDANRVFHQIITDASQSERLGQVLNLLVEAPVVLRTARKYSTADLQQSARDHDELIAALRAGDAEWARAVMGGHLRRAFHTFSGTTEAAG